MLRAGLRALISRQADMEVVAEAATGAETIAAVGDRDADVVVLDLSMPGMTAIEALQGILARRPRIRILVLTMHDDYVLASEMLRAGAAGYLVKTASHRELLSAIRAVNDGRTVLDVSLVGAPGGGAEAPAWRGPAPHPGWPEPQLSQREVDVLRLLAQGLTNREIGERLQVGVKSVETYRLRLSRKLDLKRRQDFIRYATENGLLDPTQAEADT